MSLHGVESAVKLTQQLQEVLQLQLHQSNCTISAAQADQLQSYIASATALLQEMSNSTAASQQEVQPCTNVAAPDANVSPNVRQLTQIPKRSRNSSHASPQPAGPPILTSTGKHPNMELPDGKQRDTAEVDGELKQCNCKKSLCLKLYCECFAAGGFCGSGCSCVNCNNAPGHERQIQQAKIQILARSPNAFAPKVMGETRHKKGCKCRKTRCLKKYCECFQAGVLCSSACRCESCSNMGPSGPQDPDGRMQHTPLLDSTPVPASEPVKQLHPPAASTILKPGTQPRALAHTQPMFVPSAAAPGAPALQLQRMPAATPYMLSVATPMGNVPSPPGFWDPGAQGYMVPAQPMVMPAMQLMHPQQVDAVDDITCNSMRITAAESRAPDAQPPAATLSKAMSTPHPARPSSSNEQGNWMATPLDHTFHVDDEMKDDACSPAPNMTNGRRSTGIKRQCIRSLADITGAMGLPPAPTIAQAAEPDEEYLQVAPRDQCSNANLGTFAPTGGTWGSKRARGSGPRGLAPGLEDPVNSMLQGASFADAGRAGSWATGMEGMTLGTANEGPLHSLNSNLQWPSQGAALLDSTALPSKGTKAAVKEAPEFLSPPYQLPVMHGIAALQPPVRPKAQQPYTYVLAGMYGGQVRGVATQKDTYGQRIAAVHLHNENAAPIGPNKRADAEEQDVIDALCTLSNNTNPMRI